MNKKAKNADATMLVAVELAPGVWLHVTHLMKLTAEPKKAMRFTAEGAERVASVWRKDHPARVEPAPAADADPSRPARRSKKTAKEAA